MTALLILGSFVGVVILMVVNSIFNGYALSVLWGWFVVPTFGATVLGVVPAIGLAMVVSYLTQQVTVPDPKEKDERDFGEKIIRGTVTAIIKPFVALFFGWIVHLFM